MPTAAQLNNIGRLLIQIPGITGVNSGGIGLINLPTNARYHRLIFQCTNNGVPVNPATLLTSVRLMVNGSNVRDITAANILGLARTVGYAPANGELPIWFTEPARNILQANDSNAWDMFGQSTFSINMGIAAVIGGVATVPGIIGLMEYDGLRNLRSQGATQVPFLQPLAQHQYQFNGVAGRNDVNTLPVDFPISRLFVSSGAGNNITLLEIYQDGNKIVEGTPAQLAQAAAHYGFLLGGANPFESAALFDMDQRWWKSMKVGTTMNVRVTLAAADTINIVTETMPGAYQS